MLLNNYKSKIKCKILNLKKNSEKQYICGFSFFLFFVPYAEKQMKFEYLRNKKKSR